MTTSLLVVFKDGADSHVEAIAKMLRLIESVADVKLLDAEPDRDLAAYLRTDAIWRERLRGLLAQAESEERWRKVMRRSEALGTPIAEDET